MSHTALARTVSLPDAPVPQPNAALRKAGRRARLARGSTDDPMTALIDALPTAIGRRLRFYEPGAVERSFDEAWLDNIFDAIRQGDTDRYRFALLSRMSREKASAMHFLFCKAAQHLHAAA